MNEFFTRNYNTLGINRIYRMGRRYNPANNMVLYQ